MVKIYFIWRGLTFQESNKTPDLVTFCFPVACSFGGILPRLSSGKGFAQSPMTSKILRRKVRFNRLLEGT